MNSHVKSKIVVRRCINVLLKRGCMKAEQYFEKLIEMNENNMIHPIGSGEAKQIQCRIFHRGWVNLWLKGSKQRLIIPFDSCWNEGNKIQNKSNRNVDLRVFYIEKQFTLHLFKQVVEQISLKVHATQPWDVMQTTFVEDRYFTFMRSF